MKKTYGVHALPQEIQTFVSYDNAINTLTKWCHDANIPIKKTDDYCRSHRFMYIFPDKSICTLVAHEYNKNSVIPKWEYYTHIKNANSNIVSNLGSFTILNHINDMVKETNPYGYEFALQKNIPMLLIFLYPQIEQLQKAGFTIANVIIDRFKETIEEQWHHRYYRLSSGDLKDISMIFHKGTSLYDIIGFSRDIAKEMKSVTDITFWNVCRKLYKKGFLDVESLRFLKEANYDEPSIQNLYNIVIKGTDGANYFTIPSLLRYLRKVDMYEAIPVKEALILIQDYIRCCHALSVRPRFDSDSLKREHDVMARNARTKIEQNKRESLTRKMQPACQELHQYDYKEDIFFVRAIDSFDDLLDEAAQQANCVAGYANSIANRTSKIFVMRETANPDKSLITIELSPDNTIRQKYMSHNRPIRSKAHSDFIDRWVKHIRSRAS